MDDKRNNEEQKDENLQKDSSEIKPSNKILKRIVIGMIILIFVIGGVIVKKFNDTYINTEVISQNIIVNDINVSNLTKEDAIKKVKEIYEPQNIKLNYKNEEILLKPQDIELKINTDKIIEEAYAYTKTDSYIENVKRVLSLREDTKEYELKVSYDDKKLKNILKDISKEMDIDVSNASIHISDGGAISRKKSSDGRKLDIDKSMKDIKSVIDDLSYKKVDLHVDKINPSIKTSDVESVNTLLSSHTTKFKVSETSVGRVHNIKLAANKSSDILLMPGQEFSYNTLTGMRTVGNGYQNAPVIVKGELVEGLGGGVCQVSTTLYNAVLNSGTKITAVMNHSLKSSYAPPGKDAMVNDAGTDFRFKNSFSHPIYVKNTVIGDTLTSKIYGNSSDKKNITIKTEEFVQNGLDAANTYRQYRNSNGQVISTEYIDTSVYKKPKEESN